jgi:hypothetical protein
MISAFPPLRTPKSRIPTQKWLPVTPLFATLTTLPQIPENTTTLSSVFATLTSRVKHKFFVCHSYKKHPGWGYISFELSLTALRTTHHSPPTIPFRMRTSAKGIRNPLRVRTSKTQDLKPFRIRTYEKTLRGVPLLLSLLAFAPSAIIIGLASPPGPTTLCLVRTLRTHDAA